MKRGERSVYVLEFKPLSGGWIRSVDNGMPFRNLEIAKFAAAEAEKRQGYKYRIVRYIRAEVHHISRRAPVASVEEPR